MVLLYTRPKFKKLCVYLTICVLGLLMLLPTYLRVKFHQSVFGVRKIECLIPDIKMDLESSRYLNHNVSKPICDFVFPPLVSYKENTIIRVHYPFINTSYLNCSYTPLYRKDPKPKESNYAEDYKMANFNMKFGEEEATKSEFIMVNCSYNKEAMYEEYFALLPKKSRVVYDKPPKAFNVLLLGIKSVSRFNIHRTMPDTVEYILRELNAIEYVKYNKIGRSSFDNLSPLLTGLDSDEFQYKCPKFSGDSNKYCPFIWDTYAYRGYKTAFIEDCVKNGIFKGNYVFKVKPTDYYWAPLNIAASKNTGNVGKSGCNLCFRSKPSYNILLDYASNFVTSMAKRQLPYFGLFWINSLTSSKNARDGLNLIKAADMDLKYFFQSLKKGGLLSNTIVVFFSDSGYMTRELKNIRQYRIQEKLPFLFFILPEKFSQQYPILMDRVRTNGENLVTAFDLYRTLQKLAHADDLTAEDVHDQYKLRAHSLFDILPSIRLCSWAGIGGEFCSCEDAYGDMLMQLFY